ncbi:alpha/beta fold hydrolase [Euzebya tangerina]|uniref:alpha/beta fold hydrolase n=1 Tax=Euzebya tangerina TaxID=591198 RepID=UPI000E31A2CF|nr:alpha/beta hydrolase [Euzebya tangerina]
MPLPPGVTEHTIQTDRIEMRYTAAGPEDGVPVVLLHGNLSTCRFMDDQMAACPDSHRFIAPDMRGFGGSEKVALDATRGLRDWSDDTMALLDALGVTEPAHLAGWSTGGGAIMQALIDHPERVASLSLIGTVSPYGFAGTRRDGTLITADAAGTGGGGGNPDMVAQLRAGDTGLDHPLGIRNVMRAFYWSAEFSMDEERELELADEVLASLLGDEGYPGDATASDNWPGFAPGTTGILNALSPLYLDTSGIVDVDPKPPIMWHRGSADLVVADGSGWDIAALGLAGVVPGYPGEEAFPVQEMVSQTRDVLEAYAAAGGWIEEVVYDGGGHGPHIDHADDFNERFLTFVTEAP